MFPALCLCWGQNTRISSEVSFPLGIIRWTPYSKEKSDDSDENTLITDQGHMDYLEGNYARNRAARGAQVGGALGAGAQVGGAPSGGALGGGARPKVATVEGAMMGQ